jgi:hypothetical protein
VQSDSQVYKGSAVIKANVTYYTGGPVSDTHIKWTFKTEKASFTPPGFSQFTFFSSSKIHDNGIQKYAP